MPSQYRVPVLEQFEWQPAVINMTTSVPPGSPVKGDRYVVATGGSGAWAGKDKNIAWYDGAAWQFDVAAAGWSLFDKNTNLAYVYKSNAWSSDEMLKSVYDTTANGIVDKAETVDDGAGNATTAAQVKTAYTSRGTYDSGLKAIVFSI